MYKIIFSAIFCGILIFAAVKKPFGYTKNTPGGYTGSPADGMDCSACHGLKKPIKVDTLIQIMDETGINVNSYIPEKIYEVKMCLNSEKNRTKFGFQISPQNAEGNLLGKIIITNPAETAIMDKKYLNQTETGVIGQAGKKQWSCKWQAPEKGSGTVNFYGSFLIGGNPELVYNCAISLTEIK